MSPNYTYVTGPVFAILQANSSCVESTFSYCVADLLTNQLCYLVIMLSIKIPYEHGARVLSPESCSLVLLPYRPPLLWSSAPGDPALSHLVSVCVSPVI